MNNHRKTLLLLLALGLGGQPGDAVCEAFNGSVVCVRNMTDPDNPQQGSGFIVHSDERTALIATLIHVVRDSRDITVTFEHDRFNPVPASTVRLEQNVEDGFVLLLVEHGVGRPLPTVSIVPRTKALEKGVSLVVIGCPLSSQADWPRSECKLRGQAGNDLEIEGNITQGNSGGPVFYQGKLVGVVYRTGRHASDAYKSDKLCALLDGWGVDYRSVPLGSKSLLLPPVTTGADLSPEAGKRLKNDVCRSLESALGEIGLNPRIIDGLDRETEGLARLNAHIVSAGRTVTTNPMTGSSQFNYRVELQVTLFDPDQGNPVPLRGFETEKALADLGDTDGFQRAADKAARKIVRQLRAILNPAKERNR